MLLSMTGYGKGLAENQKICVEVEVKSVNSRYLDIYLKLPNSLMSRDYEIRELIKKKIKRGKLTVITQVKINGVEDDLPKLDKTKLKNQIAIIKEIKKAISQALDQLLKMKKAEGKELEKDLNERLANIEKHLDKIQEETANGGVEEYFNKLKERVKTLLDGQQVDNERLELELAVIADKSDITEECVRLRSHIKFFTESVKNESEPGRKINFLCQELNREANTISSKSISTSITHKSVFIKEEIEKIREQIQNIE